VIVRVEDIPVVLGAVIAIIGVALMWDAWGPQTLGPMRERRRRVRASLDTPGELMAGLGVLLVGAALIGREWRFETVTVLVGTFFILVGALRNRKYFREVLLFRGSARRNTDISADKKPRNRIR
ncbi:MAG: hypothetical protein ABI194_04075, partial [Gemmatimonadaceae bacterium]